ncbi:thyroid hormone receptor-associated protein 3 isoform X3 [Cryptotermes secundus]|uniref:thyroid hormone receptor-associated protein 3 isoform X3 n=1 Tax=Cryptotermes secundus TaxID=105785 RepID=UPI000CD7CD9B|nr:thyroid hormone receptor-associated protein 3 isoform X3 [Cryptotermes secundus]
MEGVGIMRSRSPSRRSTPPPPRISRRSPGGFRTRGKSPDRRRRMPPPSMAKYVPGGRGGSPTRGRNRREFRHSPRSQPPGFPFPRRSRSPLQREPKRQSFSPGKRKLSPKRERERERPRVQGRERERRSRPPIASPRKRTRSKSPEASAVSSTREGGHLGSYGGSVGGPSDVSPPGRSYQGLPSSYPQGGPGPEGDPPNRNIVSMSERFHGPSGPGSYKMEQSDHPVFRGPEGTGFDVNELKKITVDIRRNLPVDMVPIERSIINPEDVVLVRRPATEDKTHYRKGEGTHPIFAREEIMQASTRGGSGTIDEHRRVVAIVGETTPMQSQGSSRFESPGRYADAPSRSHDSYYPSGEREPPRDYPHSAQDYGHGHGPAPGFDHRERSREDRFDRRSEDLRHELEQRRRDDSRYLSQGDGRRYDRSMDYRGDSDRGSSDLRMRINEKRTDRHDDRDSGHARVLEHRPELMERDRERERPHRGMMQHSPPGSERRRGPGEGFGRTLGDGKMRGGSGGGRVVQRGGPADRNDVPDRFHQEPTEFSSQRSDRFHYKSWDSNPEHVPKGRAYFEHDNREDEFMRGRGRGMLGQRGSGMHGRGMMRGRSFRGGGPTHIFMGRSGRRGGYPPRYTTRPSSPHWEHDLFDNVSADDCGQASNSSHGK